MSAAVDYSTTAANEYALVLYELALSLGGSLDSQVMFATMLDAFVRKLNCSAVAAFVARPGSYLSFAVHAIPRDRQQNLAIQAVQQLLPEGAGREAWLQLQRQLPLQGKTGDSGFYYLLPIGQIGLLALVCHDTPLPPALLQALNPLLVKLMEATRACLQSEELAALHRNTVLERNMLRALIEATPTIVFAIDSEGRYVFSEGRGLDALGRAPGEVVGQSIFAVYADVPAITENIRAALQGEQRAVTVELRDHSFDALYTPVIDEAGLVTGVVGVAHDVTERKAALDTLGAVLNTVGEGIITVDTDSKIVMVNPTLGEIFGYSEAEMVGQQLTMLMPPIHRDRHMHGTARYLATRASNIVGQRIELEGLHRDGRTFPIEVCINEMQIGDQLFFTGSIRDVSDQKEYDRLRDEFVSTVSHELRTPLTSIMGWTETLLTEHPGPLSEPQKRFLNIIYNSSIRLNRLIEEILTVSRIQRGTLRLVNERFQPSRVLAVVVEALGQTGERQGIQIQVEDSWPAEQMTLGDPQQLEQVLTNLIANAIKFSHAGDVIHIRSSAVHGAWRVEIQDHGMGIPAADLPRIFQRFMRGSNARSAQIQGTGLGLYVSKAIIEGHGGEIHLTSHEGAGTTVWFYIPGPRAADGS